MMLSEINDHCTNGEAIVKENGFYITKNGTRHRKMTTRGWELCVEWKEGSYDLVSLKDLKNLYPIELSGTLLELAATDLVLSSASS